MVMMVVVVLVLMMVMVVVVRMVSRGGITVPKHNGCGNGDTSFIIVGSSHEELLTCVSIGS